MIENINTLKIIKQNLEINVKALACLWHEENYIKRSIEKPYDEEKKHLEVIIDNLSGTIQSLGYLIEKLQ